MVGQEVDKMKIILNLYVVIFLSLINNRQIIKAQSDFVKPTVLNNNCDCNILRIWGINKGEYKYYEKMGDVFINIDTNKYKNKSIGYIYNDLKNQYEIIDILVSNSGEKLKPESWHFRNTIQMKFKLNDSSILRINACINYKESFIEKNDSIALDKILAVKNFEMFSYSENIRKSYYRDLKRFYRGYYFKKDKNFNLYKKYFPDIFSEVENKYLNEFGRTFINYPDSNKIKKKNIGKLVNEISGKYKLLKTTMVNDTSFLEPLVWLKKYNIIYTFLKDDSTLFEVGIRLKDTVHQNKFSIKKIKSINDYESDFILIDVNKFCKQIIEDTKYSLEQNELSYSDIRWGLQSFKHDRITQLILKYYPDIATKYNFILK
jgi:hypothetical protein